MSKILDKIFSRNGELPWQNYDEETIIINPESQNSFELNAIGSFVWSRLDGKNTVGHIQQAICEEYEVNAEMVENDLNQLFMEMTSQNLIVERP